MVNKKKVLIIGCGNIGALYDFKKDGVKTHVKAFTENGNFETVVYDNNVVLAEEIADHYSIRAIEDLNDVTGFDAVVISTPTSTHFDYLTTFLEKSIPVIVCEKPVTDSIEKLEILLQMKRQSSSKVLVNYFRRFHPCYKQLKGIIQGINEKLTNIQITYQRGFSNNASHALDLLYFFFGEQELTEITIGPFAFDEFDNDPTLTLSAVFDSVPVSFHGLQYVKHSFFEIKLFFATKVVSIEHNGRDIRLFSAEQNKTLNFYLPLQPMPSDFEGIDATHNAMQHVAATVYSYIQNPLAEDNFANSIQINRQTLKIIQSICHN